MLQGSQLLNASAWELPSPSEASNTSVPALSLRSSQVATSATMFSVGVVGNLIAIAVLRTSKREQRESSFYTLICGLALTDLLGTCCTSPVVIATYLGRRWPGGAALCHFFSFCLLFFGAAGTCILCAMALERYLAISHAYFYSRHAGRGLARAALLGAYLGSLLLCAMPSFGLGRHVRHFPGTWCFLDWRATDPLAAAYSYLYGGVLLLLIAITLLCNLAVCASLVRMSQRARLARAEVAGPGAPRASRRFPRLPSPASAAEIQMFWLLILMTAVFLICSIPLVVQIFVNQLHETIHILAGEPPDIRKDLLAIRFASFNPILDPWVYILCRKNLLVKGCERVKRTVGMAKEGRTHRVGWASGQHSPPSFANSLTTSYASLRAREEINEVRPQGHTRTKSFTDFTKAQTWDQEDQGANCHPFRFPLDNPAEFENSPSATPQQTKAMLCTVIPDKPSAAPSQMRPGFSRQQREEEHFEIVTYSLSTPNSCFSEKSI
ncbi:prostaglandin E2 receptor EP4 subtype-like [Ambystoma mexicanum]|uniref:prostaglandin E2 receptor EP4 subtype-like n=1 Tax=Ambystoma mexicanum TaxID=8296 RepID=UPI0037E751A3